MKHGHITYTLYLNNQEIFGNLRANFSWGAKMLYFISCFNSSIQKNYILFINSLFLNIAR